MVPAVTAGGFLLLRLEAGPHDIVLEPHLTRLRAGLLGLAALVAAACIAVFVRERRR